MRVLKEWQKTLAVIPTLSVVLLSFLKTLDGLPSEDDKAIMTKLNECYKYAVAINNHDHPFPAEPVIMALLLSQHKMINYLKSIIQTKQSDNEFEDD